jgi:hypothetical protein
MPAQFQTFEILFGGMDQKTDAKVIKAGKLVRAINVEFTRHGQITKRRGYRRYRFSSSEEQIGALGRTMEPNAIRVATFQDELLIFGVEYLWSIASKDRDLDGSRAAIRRGRLSPGNLRVVHVSTGGA